MRVLRRGVAEALLITSPEYARGVTGIIKNLLDRLAGRSRGLEIALDVHRSRRFIMRPAFREPGDRANAARRVLSLELDQTIGRTSGPGRRRSRRMARTAGAVTMETTA